jgi:uncharacterized membrane protein YqjE
MMDWILAPLALITLGIFLAILVINVPELDMAIVIGIALLLAVIDVGLTLFQRKKNGSGD